MEYLTLGRSGLLVSKYVLGTLTFSGTHGFEALGNIDVPHAKKFIDIALDAGVNAIDTANLYSKGDAEIVLGDALAGRRDRVHLFSKGRSVMFDGPNGGGASRAHLTLQLESSLKRLRTDYLDLYFVHQWDGVTPIEETVETMTNFVKTGKIRYWGISNYSGWSVAKTAMISQTPGFVPPVAHQIYYTPEAREAEYELLTADQEFGLASMIWSPLGQGLFSGKAKSDGSMPEGTRRGTKGWLEPYVTNWTRFARVLEAVEHVAKDVGCSVPQVTLAWLRQRAGVGPIVVGARTEAQLIENLASHQVNLTKEHEDLIEEAGRPAPIYPFWHRSMWATDRPTQSEAAYLDGYRKTIGL